MEWHGVALGIGIGMGGFNKRTKNSYRTSGVTSGLVAKKTIQKRKRRKRLKVFEKTKGIPGGYMEQ